MNNNIEVTKIVENAPIIQIREGLLYWWDQNKRSFPWRETQDPYKLLVAEILLHRTRATQVVPLYEQFLERFPNVHSLAKSTLEELMDLFHSAGLHWRWNLLLNTANDLETRFSGEVPNDFDTLVSLPGISHYIASAIRCFSFGFPDVILDTNTVRVTGRLLGLPVKDTSRRSRLFRVVLEKLIDKEHPREFNFALIDFAATVCRSKNPVHNVCCLQQFCSSYNSHLHNN